MIFQEKNNHDSIGGLLCKLAIDNSAKSIVVGQRGLATIKRIFGSVSDHVLHHASIPVIIVPSAKGKKSQ